MMDLIKEDIESIKEDIKGIREDIKLIVRRLRNLESPPKKYMLVLLKQDREDYMYALSNETIRDVKDRLSRGRFNGIVTRYDGTEFDVDATLEELGISSGDTLYII